MFNGYLSVDRHTTNEKWGGGGGGKSRGYKNIFMLNPAEHEILNAHKCKNIKIFSFFMLR